MSRPPPPSSARGRAGEGDAKDNTRASGASARSLSDAVAGPHTPRARDVQWTVMVRRVEAEETAREAAVSSLAAYVERAVRSLSARVDDMRSMVEAERDGSRCACAGARGVSETLEAEWMHEISSVRSLVSEARVQQECCIRELSEKLAALKTAQEALALDSRQQEGALRTLADAQGALKERIAEDVLQSQKLKAPAWQSSPVPVKHDFDTTFCASPLASLEALQSKDLGYESCVIREQSDTATIRPGASVCAAICEDSVVIGEENVPVGHRVEVVEAHVSDLSSESRRLAHEVVSCRAATDETRRIIADESYRLSVRLGQLEHDCRKGTLGALSPHASTPPVFAACAGCPLQTRCCSPAPRATSPGPAGGIGQLHGAAGERGGLTASRSFGALPTRPSFGAAPPPTMRATLGHIPSAGALCWH